MDADASKLSPLRTRLLVYAVLVLIALGAILLIDRRAMQPTGEHDPQPREGSSAALVAHTLV